jgi:hypothetical protein
MKAIATGTRPVGGLSAVVAIGQKGGLNDNGSDEPGNGGND